MRKRPKYLVGIWIFIVLAGLLFPFVFIYAQEETSKKNWAQKIVIGIVPSFGPQETLQKYQPLMEYLEKSLEVKTEPLIPNDYFMLVMGLAKKQIDFAYLSPKTYIDAKSQTGCELLVVELDQSGNPGTRSIIFTSKVSGITSLEQAKGKVLAFTSSDSLTGFIVPSNYFIKELKQTPGKFASQMVFAGSHLAVVQGVATGKYAIGATNDKDLIRCAELLKISPDQFLVLWKSDLIPGAVFVARKDLPDSLKKAFQNALLSLQQNKNLLNKIGIGGYALAKDSDFDVLRNLEAPK